MNQDLTKVITAMVVDQNGKDVFAQKDGLTYQVQSKEEFSLGDTVKGFAYLNQANKPMLTTDIPAITNEHYGWAKVVDQKRNLGIFVDIGLADKDIVVSLDDLPQEGQLWPRVGDQVLIKLTTDKKDRIWGVLADQKYFKAATNRGNDSLHNNDISGTVVELRSAGEYVMTNDHYLAYIPQEERDETPRLGQNIDGRVIGVRVDGVLYISLQPRAHEVMDEDAKMIYAAILRSEDKAIPYHDKSDPQAIRDYFGISKGQFKRAVGRLMKENLVDQDGEKTFAIKE